MTIPFRKDWKYWTSIISLRDKELEQETQAQASLWRILNAICGPDSAIEDSAAGESDVNTW